MRDHEGSLPRPRPIKTQRLHTIVGRKQSGEQATKGKTRTSRTPAIQDIAHGLPAWEQTGLTTRAIAPSRPTEATDRQKDRGNSPSAEKNEKGASKRSRRRSGKRTAERRAERKRSKERSEKRSGKRASGRATEGSGARRGEASEAEANAKGKI